MNRSPDLDTTLSVLNGLQPQLEELRRHLVPLLATLPLPHSAEVRDLHSAIDKTIRAGELVRKHLPTWAHLVEGRRSRA